MMLLLMPISWQQPTFTFLYLYLLYLNAYVFIMDFVESFLIKFFYFTFLEQHNSFADWIAHWICFSSRKVLNVPLNILFQVKVREEDSLHACLLSKQI